MLKSLINSSFFYFLLPAYLAVILLLTFFYIPQDFYFGIVAYYLIITLPILLLTLLFPFKMALQDYYASIIKQPRYKYIIFLTCIIITLCGPLDIYINGFKLLHPETYAIFKGVGRYIRHITILCWIFIPVAFIFVSNRFIKVFLCSYALLFPILIIDRNRLFLGGYTFFLCYILSYLCAKKNKLSTKLTFICIPIIICAVFSSLGFFRSGNMLIIPSSSQNLIPEAYPLSDALSNLVPSLQQVILYVTSPIFNFSTVVASNFLNPEVLQSQFSPFSRETLNAYLYTPIFVPRFNVGTEFYPFLLYGGLPLVVPAYLFLLAGFMLSSFLLKRYPNIFTFLIFIKISYSALFMNFAPQYYILLNFLFCILMLVLWSIAATLNWAVTTHRKEIIYEA
ncbi:hypothetical protein [Legionella gresilensis]|uniref:hypothetical protein n=1 Tax=Legionella gresilensis TaxID=91823 RepID=UPI0010412658|nr:hypothetical protein [Legionella gresilensis]